jgi:two-component sensor histidine kinase
MLQNIFDEELLKGIYIGILFIMVFYNLFIYFSIKDKSYLYYVTYIFFFLSLQLNDLGYTHKYLFYDYPIFHDLGIKILPSLTSIAAILFVRKFLNTKQHCPTLDNGLTYIIIAFTLVLGFSFNNQDNGLFFTLINILTLSIALYLLLIGIILSYKDTFLAKYFLIAWSILLLSIIQFNLSNLNLIPYYEITDHSLEIGSLIEVFLLSLALAHRINVFKKEKEISQEETIKLINEKKNIIKNQNAILENLVFERTKELEQQNKIISDKDAEKSIMMREIHHRVKNNLQMISSMVRLQTRYHDKNNTIDSLKEVERRILTMAILHEKMYQSENLVSINIKDFITTVVVDLLDIYKTNKTFEYKVDAENINLKSESILYLGLLISELITNSLKHGFLKQDDGYLYINLSQKGSNDYNLNVSNNGEEIDINKFNTSNSLGHRLITNFVKQLDGVLSIQSNNEITTFSIKFKEAS